MKLNFGAKQNSISPQNIIPFSGGWGKKEFILPQDVISFYSETEFYTTPTPDPRKYNAQRWKNVVHSCKSLLNTMMILSS